MAVTVLCGADDMRAAVGKHLGYSDWLHIDQQRIDLFAQATGDALASFLPLALSNMFLPQIVEVAGFTTGINYGCNHVRLAAPLSVDARVRGGAQLTNVSEVVGGLQTTMTITIEVAHGNKPACEVQSISRWLY